MSASSSVRCRLAARREAPLDAMGDEARAEDHREIDQRDGAEDFERPERLLCQVVGLIEQVGVRDRRDQGRRLHQLDRALHEGRNHPLHGLWQDDATQRLRSIDTMPARNPSAKNAADWIEKVSAAATKGVISTWIRIGSAKKNQNSCTSGGVVRKNSITKPAGIARLRRRASRISASTRPSGIPNASAVALSFRVLTRP